MSYNFQTEKSKIKLLKECKSITQNIPLLLKSILQNAGYLQHSRLSLIFVVFDKKLPGFDQQLQVKFPVFPIIFGAEHY